MSPTASAWPTPPPARVHLSRQWIPEGDAGIAATLGVMRDLIRQGAIHPDVRRAAVEATAYLSHSDQAGEVDAVADWILARTDYRPDPLLSEWLQEPWAVLGEIERGERPALDCDDLVILSLSMLGAIGFETALQVVATRPDRQLDHVYGMVRIAGRWEALDLTLGFSGGPPGPEYRAEMVAV